MLCPENSVPQHLALPSVSYFPRAPLLYRSLSLGGVTLKSPLRLSIEQSFILATSVSYESLQ